MKLVLFQIIQTFSFDVSEISFPLNFWMRHACVQNPFKLFTDNSLHFNFTMLYNLNFGIFQMIQKKNDCHSDISELNNSLEFL